MTNSYQNLYVDDMHSKETQLVTHTWGRGTKNNNNLIPAYFLTSPKTAYTLNIINS